MANILKTYDPKAVKVAFDGIDLSEGFAPDTFIEITPDDIIFRPVLGMGKRVVRVRSNNPMSTVNLSLLQNSDANKELMGIVYDISSGATQDTSDVSRFTISDSSNTVLVDLQECYIEGIPDFSLAKTYGIVTWTFRAGSTQPVSRANDGFSGIGGLF